MYKRQKLQIANFTTLSQLRASPWYCFVKAQNIITTIDILWKCEIFSSRRFAKNLAFTNWWMQISCNGCAAALVPDINPTMLRILIIMMLYGSIYTLPPNHFWPDLFVTSQNDPKPFSIHINKSFHPKNKKNHWGPEKISHFLRFFTYFHSALPNMAVFACFWPVFAIKNDHQHHRRWMWVNSHL